MTVEPDWTDDENPDQATVAGQKQTAGWSAEIRERAIALYEEVGPTEASRQLGAGGPDKSTISRWARAAGAESFSSARTEAATRAASLGWAHQRASMAAPFGAASAEALQASRTAIGDGKATDAKAYALTSAILFDKADQAANIANGRVDHLVIDVSEQAATLARLLVNAGDMTLDEARPYLDVESAEVNPE